MSTIDDVADVAPSATPAADPDPAVESLRERYASGALTEDEVDAEIRRLALARSAQAGPDGAIRTGPVPFGRFVNALGAFCDAYMAYDPGDRR